MANFQPELEVGDDVLTVWAAGKKVTIPAAALPELRRLFSGHPVDLAPDDTDTIALAAALTNAGICTELTPALEAAYDGMITTGSSAEG